MALHMLLSYLGIWAPSSEQLVPSERLFLAMQFPC